MPKANARSRSAKRTAKAAGRKPAPAKGAAPRKASAGRAAARRAGAKKVAKVAKVAKPAKTTGKGTAKASMAASRPTTTTSRNTNSTSTKKKAVSGVRPGAEKPLKVQKAVPVGVATNPGPRGEGIARFPEASLGVKRSDGDGGTVAPEATGARTTADAHHGAPTGGAAAAGGVGSTSRPPEEVHPGLPIPIASFTI